MKSKTIVTLALLGLFTLNPQLSTGFAQGTAFTYNGRLQAGGMNFTGAGQFKFALVSGGTNITRQATAVATVTSGFVTRISVVDGGSGYVGAPAVTISDSTGSGATATAAVSGGRVTSITVQVAGSGYSASPNVAIAPPPPAFVFDTYWSHDGTSTAGSEPATFVTAVVNGGLFTLVLGDTNVPNMQAISAAVFDQPVVQMRIWFNDGVRGFAQLTPDQRLTSTPYAVRAATAASLMSSTSAVVDLRIKGLRALRLEDNGDGHDVGTTPDGAPNLIGGSAHNLVAAGVVGATIAGGGATNFSGSSIPNSIRSDFGVIGGGLGNAVAANSPFATIAGGILNDIGTNSLFSAIGGGNNNRIAANSRTATIAGGSLHDIDTNSSDSAIGGGNNNNIAANSAAATIAGGDLNNIGSNSPRSGIGGGNDNRIAANSQYATIGGGLSNDATNIHATVGGGQHNTAGGGSSTVAGGANNAAAGGSSAIGGGFNNAATGIGGTVGGGVSNTNRANQATIAGGGFNVIGSSSDYSAIGGGQVNSASGRYATVPGGILNTAQGDKSFAAGNYAQALHEGSFVWADSETASFDSTARNQFSVRATGGVRMVTGLNGLGNPNAGVSLDADGTSWNVISDGAAKKNFRPVDNREILERLAQVPILRWNYIWEADESVPHIGPTAQDFKAAFFPGRNDKTISTLEADGVALAAIQALNQKLEETRAENVALKARLAALEERLGNSIRKGTNHENQVHHHAGPARAVHPQSSILNVPRPGHGLHLSGPAK